MFKMLIPVLSISLFSTANASYKEFLSRCESTNEDSSYRNASLQMSRDQKSGLIILIAPDQLIDVKVVQIASNEEKSRMVFSIQGNIVGEFRQMGLQNGEEPEAAGRLILGDITFMCDKSQ